MILKAIKESMNEVIIQFSEGNVNEEEVLKMVNRAIHYNYAYRPYIWEMFFIQALELDKVPKNISFLVSLFTTVDNEMHLLTNKNNTRSRVLQKLNMPEIDKIYLECLNPRDDFHQVKMNQIRKKIQNKMNIRQGKK